MVGRGSQFCRVVRDRWPEDRVLERDPPGYEAQQQAQPHRCPGGELSSVFVLNQREGAHRRPSCQRDERQKVMMAVMVVVMADVMVAVMVVVLVALVLHYNN